MMMVMIIIWRRRIDIIILHDSQNMHAYIHMYTRVRTVVQEKFIVRKRNNSRASNLLFTIRMMIGLVVVVALAMVIVVVMMSLSPSKLSVTYAFP